MKGQHPVNAGSTEAGISILWVCCVVLPCLFDLGFSYFLPSYFLPSAPLINMYTITIEYIHVLVHMYT